jgi:hypothetical protein
MLSVAQLGTVGHDRGDSQNTGTVGHDRGDSQNTGTVGHDRGDSQDTGIVGHDRVDSQDTTKYIVYTLETRNIQTDDGHQKGPKHVVVAILYTSSSK